MVLESEEKTVILVRDFLKRVNSIELDWSGRRVRLGTHWLATEASSWGDQALSRPATIWAILPETENKGGSKEEWNVNPDLNKHQRQQLQNS